MAKKYLTDLENEIIKNCLVAVYKTICLSPFVNSYGIQEYKIDQEEFHYNLLAPDAVDTLRKLAENY